MDFVQYYIDWFKSWFARPAPLVPLPPVSDSNAVGFMAESIDPLTLFFNSVRKKLGPLKQDQVNGFVTLILKWNDSGLTDLRWFAYMLATAWHETAFTMQPIKEMGGEKYLKKKAYWPYYGRGYVQLTWKANYNLYGIAASPDRALEPQLAAHIMIDGMTKGIFTGKKLADYFHETSDPLHARRIINGMDAAAQIADYYSIFVVALADMKFPSVVKA